MPRVPTYDNFTVAPTVNPGVQVAAPEFNDFASKQASQASQALVSAGTAVSRIGADIQNQANLIRVDDAVNKATEAAMALQYARPDADGNNGGFATVMGEQALNRASGQPLAVEYQEKFKQTLDKISEGLGNDQQRKMFAMKAGDLSLRLYGAATAHETEQFRTYSLSVQEGKMKVASNAIVLDPLNKDNVKKNLDEINQAIFVFGKLKGMSAQSIEAAQVDAVSGTHLNVIKSLLMPDEKGNINVDGASAYYKEFKGQMSGVQKAEAGKLVSAGDDAKAAMNGADEIWSQMGPKGYNSPVDQFAMERKAREMYADSPHKAKLVIDELRSRTTSFDKSQSEFNAANVDAVGKMAVAGMSLATIQASPAFRALPGGNQQQITEHLTAKGDSDLAKQNFAKYLDYTNPETLAKMSRKEVEALWPVVGREHTASLVGKWDSLQNKEALLTAKIDNEQFNAVAQQLGLKPYESNKSENEKATLGRIHNNVNAAIEAEAKSKRQPLTREEKEAVMRREMAKNVTVAGRWWGSDEVRLPELTDEQMSRVVVPATARTEIIANMKKRYDQTKDDAFAPTEDNIRRWYLISVRSKK